MIISEEHIKQGALSTFKKRLGYTPDLKNPKGLNEKLLWRKVYDRRDLLVRLCDKVSAKKYLLEVREDSPVEPLPEIVGKLVYPLIIKPNNSSGGTYLIEDPGQWGETLKNLERFDGPPYGIEKGEWAYSQVKTKILYEQYLPDIIEYHCFCFGGLVGLVGVRAKTVSESHRLVSGRPVTFYHSDGTKSDWFDTKRGQNDEALDQGLLAIAVQISGQISKGIDFARVDLFYSEGQFYLGEFTLYPCSGCVMWNVSDADKSLGKLWELPK